MLTNIGESARKALQEAGFTNPEEEYRVEITRDVFDNRLSESLNLMNSLSGDGPIVESFKSLEEAGVAFVKFCAEHTTGQVKCNGRLTMKSNKFPWKHIWTVKELRTTEFKIDTGSTEKVSIKIIESSRVEAKLLTILPKLEVVG